MTALSLLRHAFGLLAQHPWKTLKVIGPALALMIGFSAFALFTAPDLTTGITRDGAALGMPINWLFLIGLTLSYSLMAILWHRHTLIDPRTGSPMSVSLILSYLLRVAQLTVIQLVVSVALITPLLIAANAAGTAGGPAFHSVMLTTFATQLLLVWLSLRLSLILPAAAIGQPIKLARSWEYTRQLNHPLWGIAAMLAVFNTALTGVVSYFGLTAPRHLLMFELPIYIIDGVADFQHPHHPLQAASAKPAARQLLGHSTLDQPFGKAGIGLCRRAIARSNGCAIVTSKACLKIDRQRAK